MEQIHTLSNNILKISIKKTGAELCSIQMPPDKQEYMWNADPKIWAGHAPVLFPIIGALKENSYFYKDRKYSLPRHGFVRNNANVELFKETEDQFIFCLRSSSETLIHFPFQFEFYVSYTLDSNNISVNHMVKNTGDDTMFFSLGGHPAFKCPLNPDEDYNDYYLEFSHSETAHSYQIEPSGLISNQTKLILNNSNTIGLHYDLFNKGALVFKDLQSRSVALISKKSGVRVQVDYEGFPYLGIWAKPKADYVCIEPWLGIADPVDTDQNLESKEGIIRLPAKHSFDAAYKISIY